MNITDYFPDYTEVGYAKKSYGVQGFIRVFIEETYLDSMKQANHCFFLLKGCLVPYFIEAQEDGLIKFESCKNPEDTKTIVSRAIYLHNDQLKNIDPKADSNLDFSIVLNFTLLNAETDDVVGKIVEVVEYPEQEIAVVQSGENEYLIPLNFFNVKGINVEESQIFVDIPEGLLDL